MAIASWLRTILLNLKSLSPTEDLLMGFVLFPDPRRRAREETRQVQANAAPYDANAVGNRGRFSLLRNLTSGLAMSE